MRPRSHDKNYKFIIHRSKSKRTIRWPGPQQNRGQKRISIRENGRSVHVAGCTSGASSKLRASLPSVRAHTHTLYSASAVLRLYFAIRARCFTSALAPCRMQEPFSRTLHPAPLHSSSLHSLSLVFSSFSSIRSTSMQLQSRASLQLLPDPYVDRLDAGCRWHRCCYRGSRFQLSSGENEIVRRARLVVLSPMDG